MSLPEQNPQPTDRTQDLLRDIHRALRRESWGRNIIQLAWTAGPVTYLALQGGYHLGYGQAAPHQLFVYFGAYTIIAGAAAIIIRVLYQATRGREVERDTRVLRDCLDQLPRLLLTARDQTLASYQEEDARLLSARHLLANPDATELAVAAAIRDLGGSRDLAYTFQRIEVFRRNGMPSRIAIDRAAVEREVERLVEALRERSPDTARLVIERSHGRAPSKRTGRLRTEGFIERALASESDDNFRLMSLTDVEEVLTLLIELLVGRSMTLIGFEFVGDRRIAEAWAALERSRREFRSRLRTRNSRLRVTAERLAGKMDEVVPSIARISNAPALRDEVVEALDTWAREFERPRIRRPHRREVERFKRAVGAYRSLEQASAALHRSHTELIRTYQRYTQTVEARTSDAETEVGFATAGGDGVRITETELVLEEKHRLALARRTRDLLIRSGVWKREDSQMTTDGMLSLAMEVLSATEDYLPLYRPEVQQAIELTRAPTIESLEPGLSADVRAGWAIALVEEVETNLAEYALRRVEQLVRFHALKLGAKTQAQICERFGIERGSLNAIVTTPAGATQPWARAPMQVPPRYDHLKRIADKASR